MRAIIDFFKRVWAFIDLTPDTYREWRTYTIKGGGHNSLTRIDMSHHSISFLVDLSGAWYDENKLGNDKYDWNKLYGLTTSRIHRNSWRIGWRIIDGRAEFAAYWYHKGKRFHRLLGSCSLNQIAEFDIWLNDRANFRFSDREGSSRKIEFIYDNRPTFVFRSFPYFGGNRPAPNDIKIKIKELL